MASKRLSRPKRSARTAARAPGRQLDHPVYAQPEPTADPLTFRVNHPSDAPAYKEIDQLNREHKIAPLPFPLPRGGVEPRLTLQQVLGDNAAAIQTITNSKQMVFHATGDCGSTRGPKTQSEVADKMVSDFNEADPKELPQFNLLLGDIVYSFGEAQYYFDQFYEPYRDYAAPILAAAGNHDGMVAPHIHVASLEAFHRNFCAPGFTVTPEAGGLSRTAQIQPGVFFTFETPFARILVLYSNTLEDPGVIADKNIGDAQIKFLTAALTRVKAEQYKGALIFAHHHPPYTASQSGSRHGWSVKMLADMDAVCQKTGVWPHAVLAGHVHNYQRFTRGRPDGTQIPYLCCGNGGHNVQRLASKGQAPLRAPQVLQKASAGVDEVVFENYDDINYGYLRIVVTVNQLYIQYHAASDGPNSKAPDDSVTVDLATRRLTRYNPTDLGQTARVAAVQRLVRTAGK
jgi:hypothetical protein